MKKILLVAALISISSIAHAFPKPHSANNETNLINVQTNNEQQKVTTEQVHIIWQVAPKSDYVEPTVPVAITLKQLNQIEDIVNKLEIINKELNLAIEKVKNN